MGKIISILQNIFTINEDNLTKVGLTSFKPSSQPTKRVTSQFQKPKELKISDLVRKSNC